MPATILVAYGTKHGSTREVAEAVAGTLAERGFELEVRPAAQVGDLAPYDGVVVGGAIYTGRWHPDALGFLESHRDALAKLPVAVFGMGPRTLEPHDMDATRAQLLKALAKVPEINPFSVAVFGGVFNPRNHRFPFNHLPATDARSWTAIRGWAAEIAGVFDFGKTAETAGDHRRELQHVPR